MICPYCEEKNPEDVQTCQFCNQRFPQELEYQESVEQLEEIGNIMIRRDIPADPSLIHRTFIKIEQQIQEIMDRATDIIESNIKDIERIRQEAPDMVGELDLETFSMLLDDFDEAQQEITGGLDNIKNSLLIADTSGDITRELHEYSSALQEINEGLARLETITNQSADYEAMTSPPPNLESPDEIFHSQRELGKAIQSLDLFDENEDPRFLKFALMKIDRVREVLLELAEDYEPGAIEEYEEEILPIIEEELEEEFLEEEEEILDEEAPVDDEYEIDEEEQAAIELMYTDVDEIAGDEAIEELMLPPDVVDEDDIYRDRDWRLIEQLEEPEETPEFIPVPGEEEEEEEIVLVDTLSTMRSDVE